MIVATASNAPQSAVIMAAVPETYGARAALYGVISHLFYGSPSPDLLQQIAAARAAVGHDASPLALAWHSLCEAASAADPVAIRGEFDAVFVSTGRPPVSLYASSYIPGRERGQLLAELRDDLMTIGYARSEQSCEYEDHLSALCDVMRGLIVEEAEQAGAFVAQQSFFRSYLAPWHGRLCLAIREAEQTVFYRPVANFLEAFFVHESEYFELA